MRTQLALCVFLILGVGCSGLKRDVDDSVDRAVDKAATKAEELVQESLKAARVEFDAALKSSRTELDTVRAGAAEDLKKVQDRLQEQIAQLDKDLEKRLEQARAGASELVSQADRATQARIDQAFGELRLFIKETLLQVKEMIQPILTLSDKSSVAIERITNSFTKLSDKSTEVLTELKNTLLTLQGKKPDGTPSDVPGWVGIIGTVLLGLRQYLDQKKNGDRWKQDEIRSEIKTSISELIKSGALDAELRHWAITNGWIPAGGAPNGKDPHA